MPLCRFTGLLLSIAATSLAGTDVQDGAGAEFFEAKVRPLLAEHCYKCHSVNAAKLKGGLRLDSRASILRGGDDGTAIVVNHPEQSRLIEAIGYSNPDLQMPPKAKLTESQIADLTSWVRMGAPWPTEAEPVAAGSSAPVFDLEKRKAANWAFGPIRAQAPPEVKNADWAQDAIDRFICAKLAANGLAPAPPAQKRALIRRAYFDLIGLPPAPAAVEGFVNDPSDRAFEKVVDELLASSHFGERWGRHWLDLVRYAETYGHEFDYQIDFAWRYRDYVIRAFNADVPYNQFVTEQIAGDLLAQPRRNRTEGFNESIIGSGFWFFGEQVHAPVDVRQHQADCTDNQIDVLGKTFLGLTIACARCHDHKFDPISQKDYYALYGILESTSRQEAVLDPNGKIEQIVRQMRQIRVDAESGVEKVVGEDGRTFAGYLDAAGRVIAGANTVESLASALNLDVARLSRWVSALKDEGVRQPSHPLFAWTAMTRGSVDGFDNCRQRVADCLAQAAQGAKESDQRTQLLFSFHDGIPRDWYVSGWSFDDQAARPGEIDLTDARLRVLRPGVIHGGLLAARLPGVLRSPSFIIQHPQLLYHVAGRGCQIRLVIDGYRMDQFNNLLFAGAIQSIQTQGQFVWLRQGGDIGRYLGHRAHIEVIDDGNGWIALDQIRVADNDAPAPQAAPSSIATRVVRDAGVTSRESLADAYGRTFDQAIEHWRAGTIAAHEVEVVNWALEHELLELDRSAQMKLKTDEDRIERLARELPEPIKVIAAADSNGVDEHLFLRGSPKNLGAVVPRRFLEAIGGPGQAPIQEGCGRLELARRMTDPSDPLLSRVMVNRVWHHLFGRGIVASADNFGVMGTAPTHPELLDYLAERFTRDGWSVKKLIRAVMLTRAYQMSSRASDERAEQLDPSNLLFHRANLRRLEAEPIRDEILALSGRLDPKMFGPPVEVFLTPFMEGRGRPSSGPLDGAGRRSIYLSVRRNFLSPMMLAFDFPIPLGAMGRRTVSNVPAQALTMLNDPFVRDQARLWAQRLLAGNDASSNQRIVNMYESAFARSPTDAELRQMLAFLQQQGAALGIPAAELNSDLPVWAELAHALMNVKEFVLLE